MCQYNFAEKRPALVKRNNVVLLYENARLHTARMIEEKLILGLG